MIDFTTYWLIGAVVLLAGYGVYRHFFTGGHSEAIWTAKVSGDLWDLHLDVKKLPPEANKKFFNEAHALHQATKGKFHRKRFAMRFFGWYVAEYPGPDIRSFNVEGAVAGSIPVMRDWARKEPELEDAAKAEIMKIGTFLYQQFEKMNVPEQEKIDAQFALLKMMGAKNPHSIEDGLK